MFTIDDVIVCMKNVQNTEERQLTEKTINECNEGKVKPKKSKDSFIKKYHHFQYPAAGFVDCQYIKGEGDLKRHEMKQSPLGMTVWNSQLH